MKLGYVTTPYFGNRHTVHPLFEKDELLYIKKHIEYLNIQTINIDKIYLICTFGDNVDKFSILNKINQLCQNDSRFIIVDRDNLGGSYASWKYALDMDNGSCDYLLLTEDDYCLYDSHGIELMLNYFKNEPDLFYLCQYWSTVPYTSRTYGLIESHAAMSCGLIDNKKYYDLKITRGLDFKIYYGNTYESFCDNQALFLEEYRKAGIKISDWRETYSSYFPNSKVEYGNPNGSKIMIPLQDDLGYF